MSIEAMDFEEDVMLKFREDACFTIYALIADALFRCTTQRGATQIFVKIRSLPPSSVPSLPPMYLLSVAHSGPGLKTSELRNFFPQFSKSCYNASPQLGLQWGGVVRVLTADVEDKDFRHYEIVMRSDSEYETIQLPRTEYDTAFDSGTISEIIVTGSVLVLVDFSRSICEKTSMLKLKNVTLDFFLQGMHTDDSGHHIKGLRIFDGIRSLGDYSAEELLCIGAVEYLSTCRYGFSEGSIVDLRFRELVQVGKGQAGSRETKWCLDACVALIDVAMAKEIFATIGPQTSVVVYFEDGCHTPAPVSVVKRVEQRAMGEVWPENEGHADSGLRRSNHAVRGVEENLNYVYDLTHPSELEYPIPPQRSNSPAGGKMVKTAAEACMTDLKARHSEYFLSENVIQMQQVATDVSECIANIIFSSTNEDFREQCASIVDLPLQKLGEIENLIRTKMVKFIQQHDGHKKRKPGPNDIARFTNELALGDDAEAEPLFYDNEDEEFL